MRFLVLILLDWMDLVDRMEGFEGMMVVVGCIVITNGL